MIQLRLVQGDSVSQYFRAVRDSDAVFLQTIAVKLRCPSGTVKTGSGVVEDSAEGEFRVDFGSGGLTLTEAGQHQLEFLFNGVEHGEEPVRVWVRPEFKRGPQ